MKKVFQTNFTPGEGNCMSACLATILGLKIEEVPNFRKQTTNGIEFYQAIQTWLKDFDMFLLVMRLTEGIYFYPFPEETIMIAGGISPRFKDKEISHACVGTIKDGYNFQLIHDPHPEGNGFEFQDSIKTYQFLVDYNIANRLNGV